jgi:peptide/nickel transport system permease protein
MTCYLGWFPIFGEESLKVMVLPAFVLGFRSCAVIARMTRSGLLEVMSEDYIRTAENRQVCLPDSPAGA